MIIPGAFSHGHACLACARACGLDPVCGGHHAAIPAPGKKKKFYEGRARRLLAPSLASTTRAPGRQNILSIALDMRAGRQSSIALRSKVYIASPSWAWRRAPPGRRGPRSVLLSPIAGIDYPRAWTMRQAYRSSLPARRAISMNRPQTTLNRRLEMRGVPGTSFRRLAINEPRPRSFVPRVAGDLLIAVAGARTYHNSSLSQGQAATSRPAGFWQPAPQRSPGSREEQPTLQPQCLFRIYDRLLDPFTL